MLRRSWEVFQWSRFAQPSNRITLSDICLMAGKGPFLTMLRSYIQGEGEALKILTVESGWIRRHSTLQPWQVPVFVGGSQWPCPAPCRMSHMIPSPLRFQHLQKPCFTGSAYVTEGRFVDALSFPSLMTLGALFFRSMWWLYCLY